jgi:hypothetical protein
VIKNQQLLNPLQQRATSRTGYQEANNHKLKVLHHLETRGVKAVVIQDNLLETNQKLIV